MTTALANKPTVAINMKRMGTTMYLIGSHLDADLSS